MFWKIQDLRSNKEKLVMIKRGSKKVYSRTFNEEKKCVSSLLTVNADGNM